MKKMNTTVYKKRKPGRTAVNRDTPGLFTPKGESRTAKLPKFPPRGGRLDALSFKGLDLLFLLTMAVTVSIAMIKAIRIVA